MFVLKTAHFCKNCGHIGKRFSSFLLFTLVCPQCDSARLDAIPGHIPKEQHDAYVREKSLQGSETR